MRPTWAEVDVAAVERNVTRLRDHVAPAAVCAVVKADGYGHGAVTVATAALRGGATWLAVALVEEGAELREAGIDAPILLLSEPRASEMAAARAADLRVTLYTEHGVRAAAEAARRAGAPWPVHVKVDTGMHRVGCTPESLCALVEAIDAEPALVLEGVWTHCSVADEPDEPFTALQLERFDAALRASGVDERDDVLVHVGNSAVGLAHPHGHRDMVRFGIAVYGIPPSPALAGALALEPALTLRTEVTHVQTVAAGEGVSYGRRWIAPRTTRIATVPIGYADGVRRDLPARGGEVLVRGARLPMVGAVTMDQLMFDCDEVPVEVGDEVVLIGSQGDQRIAADDIAARLDTIAYEVVCAIGARVPRRPVGR